MSKRKILLQLDTDFHASSFDAVVATDAGVDMLLQYSGVTPDNVEGLIHGAMFTRGPDDLKNSAVFIGGSNVSEGEALYDRVRKCFFGPMRVSVMLDSNGSNTTAAAAVIRAAKHIDLSSSTALVLAGTGPVGQRVARLLLREGATVRLASRKLERAEATSSIIADRCECGERITAVDDLSAIDGCDAVFACGAAGVQLLDADTLAKSSVRLAIDLNAVPPLGIEGVDMMDSAKESGGKIHYGAIGVGGTKMKIHRKAVSRLFESNDQELDAETIFEIAKTV